MKRLMKMLALGAVVGVVVGLLASQGAGAKGNPLHPPTRLLTGVGDVEHPYSLGPGLWIVTAHGANVDIKQACPRLERQGWPGEPSPERASCANPMWPDFDVADPPEDGDTGDYRRGWEKRYQWAACGEPVPLGESRTVAIAALGSPCTRNDVMLSVSGTGGEPWAIVGHLVAREGRLKNMAID